VYPIPHRVYEHMICCHELRDCSYVVVIDASHELPEGLDGIHCGHPIRTYAHFLATNGRLCAIQEERTGVIVVFKQRGAASHAPEMPGRIY